MSMHLIAGVIAIALIVVAIIAHHNANKTRRRARQGTGETAGKDTEAATEPLGDAMMMEAATETVDTDDPYTPDADTDLDLDAEDAGTYDLEDRSRGDETTDEDDESASDSAETTTTDEHTSTGTSTGTDSGSGFGSSGGGYDSGGGFDGGFE